MPKILSYKEGEFATIALDSGEKVMLSRVNETYILREMKFMGIVPGKVVLQWKEAAFGSEIIDSIAAETGGLTSFRRRLEEIAGFGSIKGIVQAYRDANDR